jgi:hypothetical protein
MATLAIYLTSVGAFVCVSEFYPNPDSRQRRFFISRHL